MSRPKAGWKINRPVTVLHDARYMNLTAEAVAALDDLHLWSAANATDGIVPSEAWTPALPGYSGLPRVTGNALEELAQADYLELTATGVVMPWDEWEVNRSEHREQAAAKQSKYRERESERKTFLESVDSPYLEQIKPQGVLTVADAYKKHVKEFGSPDGIT